MFEKINEKGEDCRMIFFKGFFAGMKQFGARVTDVVNFILLLVAYVLGVGLTSIFAVIAGKRFLNLEKPDKKKQTYWVDKEKINKKIDEFYNEY